MIDRRYFRFCLLVASLAAAGGLTPAERLVAQAPQEIPAVEALPPEALPELPQLALPPRACFSCPGPAACPPRLDTHSGYLYYNTYPIDDDPFNEFGDCPNGNCGYPGAALSLWWINLHDPRIIDLGHRHQRAPAGPIGKAAVRSSQGKTGGTR